MQVILDENCSSYRFTIISRFYQTLVPSLPLPSHSLTSLSFSPRQYTFWKFLKVKIHFTSCLFYIKTIIFLYMMQMYTILRVNNWFHAFCQIFVKLFAKKVKGCVKSKTSLQRREKNSKQHFSKSSPLWSKYFPNICYCLYHKMDIWRGFYQPSSTGPHHFF